MEMTEFKTFMGIEHSFRSSKAFSDLCLFLLIPYNLVYRLQFFKKRFIQLTT